MNKAELRYSGETFAEKISLELTGTGMPCYLSVANYGQYSLEGWKIVRDKVIGNDGSYIGPMGGIYSCLIQAAEDGLDGLFFTPCDAPFFRRDVVLRLADTVCNDYDALMWRTNDGRLQPTFGWYSVNCIPHIRSDIREGEYKLIKFLERIRTGIVSTAEAGIDDNCFRNINHIEEYSSF